jgi:hypothetical protein
LGILFAVIFLSVPAAVFYGIQRSLLDTSVTEEVERSIANQEIDATPPVIISQTWEGLSMEHLGVPMKPPFVLVAEIARGLNWRIAIASGIALAASIACAAIMLNRRLNRREI